MTEQAPRRILRAEFLVPALSCVFLAAGAAGVAVGVLDEGAFKARIDASSPDGSAVSFPLERTRVIQQRVGVYGGALLSAGVMALVFLKRLVALSRQIWNDCVELQREWRTDLRHWVTREPGHVLALGFAVIVAVAVRLAFLHQDMRYDEADSYLMFASRSLVYGLSDYPEPNNHLLSTLLMHLSVNLFGDAPWAVRLPTFIAGVLIIPAAYWALRKPLGRWAALIAAGLSAGSSMLVHYSVNARGYSLVVLAFFVGLALCNRMAARPSLGAAALLGVVSALGFYAVPTMLFPFGGCLLWLALIMVRRRNTGEWKNRLSDILLAGMLTVVLTLLLYGPVIVASGPDALTSNKYVSATAWSRLLDLLGERLAVFATELTRTPGVAVLLGTGLVTWLVVDAKRRARSALLPAALAIWCVLIIAVQRVPPYGRVWTFVIPLAYGIGAAGLVWIVQRSPRGRSAILGALTFGLTCWMSLDTLHTRSPSMSPEDERFEAAESIAAFFKSSLAPEDRVLTVSPVRTSLWYYMRRAGFPSEVMSHDTGGLSFTYAVVNVPLAEFNSGLTEWSMPNLEESQLHHVQDFPGAAVYRIDPPLPY
ncbi:MAG: glycosyltransferase family 39 protein [Planctomycetes bacterium]|nr:glycosyltransferase family 39 protein [Planctomycetota bacterium]